MRISTAALVLAALVLASCGNHAGTALETPKVFWDDAFERGGVAPEERTGRWVGGLARSYSFPVFHSEPGRYIYVTAGSFGLNLMDIEQGLADVDVCFTHDRCAERLVGSTNPERSSCAVSVWETSLGLYFLMFVDETEPLCVEAFAGTERREFQVSIFRRCGERLNTEAGGRLLQGCLDATLDHIAFVSAPVDPTTWIDTLDLRHR